MHMVATARLPPRDFQRVHRGQRQTRARHAERMAEGNRAAMRVHVFGIVRQAELTGHGQALRGESLVQLDHVDVADLQAEAFQQFLGGRGRADAHDAWVHAGGRHRHDAGARCQTVTLRGFLGGDDQGSSAVVHTGGIASGDCAALLAERRPEFGEGLQRGVAARVLVAIDRNSALAAGDLHRGDLAGEEAAVLRGLGAHLRAVGEGVLVGAGDLEVLGDVLRGLGHGVDAVLVLHQWVDEAPADRRVVDLGGTGERLGGLAHDERRAGHAFDTAGDHQAGVTGADRARGGADGVKAGAAQTVDCGAGNA